ncbi:MAG: hypothetical protein AB7J28_16750 [Hyphomonadaceae bacterium]
MKANAYPRWKVWPEVGTEDDAVFAYGRNAIEACEEVFYEIADEAEFLCSELAFVCKRDDGYQTVVTVSGVDCPRDAHFAEAA